MKTLLPAAREIRVGPKAGFISAVLNEADSLEELMELPTPKYLEMIWLMISLLVMIVK